MLTIDEARIIAIAYLPTYEAMTKRHFELMGEGTEEGWCFVFGINSPPQPGELTSRAEFIIVDREKGKLTVAGVNHLLFEMRQFKKYLADSIES